MASLDECKPFYIYSTEKNDPKGEKSQKIEIQQKIIAESKYFRALCECDDEKKNYFTA